MENTARALEIAAGVLIALMILSLIAYFFSSISAMPTQENESMTTKQLHEFNTEYEVYRKSAMYGVDVISCLNKAWNNNKKYNEGEGFLSGLIYSKQENNRTDAYYVDVYVRIVKPLEESLTLYRIENNEEFPEYEIGPSHPKYSKIINFTMGQVGFVFPSTYTTFSASRPILPAQGVVLSGSGYLVPGGGSPLTTDKFDPESIDGSKNYYSLRDSTELQELLKNSGNNMVQTITNTTKQDYDAYTKLIWHTALYDMKTRKFKCDYVEYSADTGRVVALYFTQFKTPKELKNDAIALGEI